jgi:folate-binding protein YgfZ
MSEASVQVAVLEDRGVVAVTGADAKKLLGGLITNELAPLDAKPPLGAPALFAGLLTPQGKILFDIFAVKTDDGFLLETLREKAPELVKRISMYKLRAAVEIRDVSEAFRVAAIWGGAPPAGPEGGGAIVFADPRLKDLGYRVLVPAGAALDATASAADYHVHRIGLGVPEGGRDYVLGDTFPHEALFDQLNGVSFTKGCFVGQEVVSRMQHRGTARKRVVPVVGDAALPAEPSPVLAGEVEIGRLGSVVGERGLALLKLDRVAQAQREGVAIMAGGVALRVALPTFARFTIEALA